MFIGHFTAVQNQKAIWPPVLVQALEALSALNLEELAPGRYELEGDKLFYLVEDARPRLLNECSAEAHRNYADIQIPVGARERFGFSLPQPGLKAIEELFEERDIAFYQNPANEFFMDVDPGSFVVFLPGELHRPCVAINDQQSFRKVVVKVHFSLLGL